MISNTNGDDDDDDWHLAGLSLLWTPPAPQEAEQAPQDSHSPWSSSSSSSSWSYSFDYDDDDDVDGDGDDHEQYNHLNTSRTWRQPTSLSPFQL